MYHLFLKNKIIKSIFSILLIIILLFDIIAPLTVNAYLFSIKNTDFSQNFNEEFVFSVGDYRISIERFPQFQSVEVPKEFPAFLVGIVNVDYDMDPISKTIARGVFLGMRADEIIKEIENNHKSRIFIFNGKRAFMYSTRNEKIVAYLDSLIVDQRAKGGVAVKFKVGNSTVINETIIQDTFLQKGKKGHTHYTS